MIIDFENNNNEIEQEYKNGLTYKEIEKKHEITHEQLKYLIKKNNWKRDSNRSKVQKGNQNAKGNKGGRAPQKNKNALITGEYERIYKDVLDEYEIEIFNNYKSKDKKEEIIEEIKILTIRERRMLSRIAKLKNSYKVFF